MHLTVHVLRHSALNVFKVLPEQLEQDRPKQQTQRAKAGQDYCSCWAVHGIRHHANLILFIRSLQGQSEQWQLL